MILVEEALGRILETLEPVGAQSVALANACGRVLAVDVTARVTQPPFAVSAMDGYAVRAADVAQVPASLRQIGEAPAGGAYEGRVEPGQTVRIFTGGPLPDGADAVVIQEDTRADGDRIEVLEAAGEGDYVRPAGLDFRAGDAGLTAPRRLNPRDIGLAAAMNVPWLSVRRRPRVAILSTGDELVRPGEPIGPNQIISSNGLSIAVFLDQVGAEAIALGIAPDDEAALERMSRGADGADMLVTIGGASVGKHDLVQRVLGRRGMAVDFWRIAMRPGKPLMFGKMGPTTVLGLPGNPVSALVCALIFLRPAIERLLGLDGAAPATLSVPLAAELAANDRRQDYLRARLRRDDAGRLAAEPFGIQDSSMLSRLAAADCLIVRPPHAPAAMAGELVDVLPLGSGAGAF